MVDEENTDQSLYTLSSHLNQVLTNVGVSQEIRSKYMMSANAHEILTTAKLRFMYSKIISCYLFGSSYEGTTTQGLRSDRDALYCLEDITVVEFLKNAPGNGHSLLMIIEDTKPGYVKLQDVLNRTPLTKSHLKPITLSGKRVDLQGRLLWMHIRLKVDAYKTEVNGPATTSPEAEQDYVVALRCCSVPSFANEWLHRIRPHQWPSQRHLVRLSSYGCFLVGVGHSKSKNKDVEWRISFSLQERDLMSCLNLTQHMCYVLLKMIKNDIIQDKVGKSISSYHCKTCLLSVIENTGFDFWTENNLVHALFQCLNLLLRWVKEKKCPNYFIKEENMFDRLEPTVLTKVEYILQWLVSSGTDFLFSLKCDMLGELLMSSTEGKSLKDVGLNYKKRVTYELYVNSMKVQLSTRQGFFRNFDNMIFPPDWFTRPIRVLQHLEQTYLITEHDPRDVRMVLNLYSPRIHLNIAQTLASSVLLASDDYDFYDILNEFEKELCTSRHCDSISSSLVLATVYLQINRLASCEDILIDCGTRLKQFVVATCGCHDYPLRGNKHLKEKLIAKDTTFAEFQTNFTAACMIFLPSQSNLVHPALRYEMYRSTPGSKNECLYCWFDWIVVDSKVYLHFLQYVLYSKTNKRIYKEKAFDSLLSLINNGDENLGHRETALNLLGWMCVQESRYWTAFECFSESWRIRPDHNAAKWHILVMIYLLYSKASEIISKDLVLKEHMISKLCRIIESLGHMLRNDLNYLRFLRQAIEY